MKAVVVTSPQTLTIKNIPDIIPGPYEAKVRVLACGICNATDLKVIEGSWKGTDPFPYILGHEAVGEVIACGSKVRNLKVGDWVLQPRIEGAPSEGIGCAWGGMVEYALATDWKAMEEDGYQVPNEFFRVQQVIPQHLSLEDAVMAITVKEVYSALVSIGFKGDGPILIVGDGPVGILMAQSACLLGGKKVVVCGHHNERLAIAKDFQSGKITTINSKEKPLFSEALEHAPEKYKYIIDAVGDKKFLADAPELLQEDGILGVYGYSGQSELVISLGKNVPSRFQIRYMVVPDIKTMVSVHRNVVNGIIEGTITPSSLVTCKKPAENVNDAYLEIKSRKALKAIIYFGSRGVI